MLYSWQDLLCLKSLEAHLKPLNLYHKPFDLTVPTNWQQLHIILQHVQHVGIILLTIDW